MLAFHESIVRLQHTADSLAEQVETVLGHGRPFTYQKGDQLVMVFNRADAEELRSAIQRLVDQRTPVHP